MPIWHVTAFTRRGRVRAVNEGAIAVGKRLVERRAEDALSDEPHRKG